MMTKLKNWPKYALSYVSWIVSFLLWFWFIFKSREAISGLLTRYYLNGPLEGSFQRTKVFQFFNQGYFYVVGLIWLIMMIVVEQYFRDGVRKGNLNTRICQVIGPEMLLLFLSDIAHALVALPSALDWLVLVVEFILAVGMIGYAIKSKQAPKPVQVKANL